MLESGAGIEVIKNMGDMTARVYLPMNYFVKIQVYSFHFCQTLKYSYYNWNMFAVFYVFLII